MTAFTRRDVSFTSGDSVCAAWLYLPTGITSPPAVILGDGLGATREMRLDAFAERFAQAGITRHPQPAHAAFTLPTASSHQR
jgi:dienelactone hydrolase